MDDPLSQPLHTTDQNPMNPQIDQLRDKIEARHVVAATHKQAYEIEQDLIAKETEELQQLLLAEQREALAKAQENFEAVGPQIPRW